ncbi:tubulin-specific chaperone B [Achlya hypogyna]|uniref:Tubulin-specific chaperone B n=1 Tax=Achlya hypogyna TaxID=1202772 RepID=A0A1V9Y522_ACHHY|nr:tubulin-specific chaperone B [Achlya hypogyna]
MSEDLRALRDYVTAKDGTEYVGVADGLVCMHITHSHLTRQIVDIRLDMHATIADVKEKIYRHCGTKPDYMTLILKNGASVVGILDDERRKLGYYPVQHGMTIHVQDNDPFSLAKGGGLDDVSLVKKYEISEADYDKRTNTVRNYKREQLAQDPNWKPPVLPGSSAPHSDLNKVYDAESVKGIEVGQRCEVSPGGRRGRVAFVGTVPELAGAPGESYWVGVVFDEPVGKGNGCAKGKRYYECADKFGGFIRPTNVTVGDFPPEDELLSDDDEF